MGFLRRLGRGPKPGPGWAGTMDARAFGRFETVLDTEMVRRGWAYRRRDDGLYVESGEIPDGRQVYGLSNLVQLCAQTDPADWPETIRHHFDTMRTVQALGDDLFESFDRVRPNLRLRVLPTDDAFVESMKLVRYRIAHNLMAVLVLDLPTTVASIPSDRTGDWPPMDELFRIALENQRAELPPRREVVDANGAELVVEMGESFFVASRLLILPEVVDLGGADGAIVAIPTRHSLLAHAIRDKSVIQALSTLAILARETAAAGPGAISSAVYWWHAGALTEIPVTVAQDNGVSITSPDEFVELLDEVASRH